MKFVHPWYLVVLVVTSFCGLKSQVLTEIPEQFQLYFEKASAATIACIEQVKKECNLSMEVIAAHSTEYAIATNPLHNYVLFVPLPQQTFLAINPKWFATLTPIEQKISITSQLLKGVDITSQAVEAHNKKVRLFSRVSGLIQIAATALVYMYLKDKDVVHICGQELNTSSLVRKIAYAIASSTLIELPTALIKWHWNHTAVHQLNIDAMHKRLIYLVDRYGIDYCIGYVEKLAASMKQIEAQALFEPFIRIAVAQIAFLTSLKVTQAQAKTE